MSHLIAVFGASGAQGGSVVKALIKSSKFKIRAGSRSIEGPAGQAFRDQGVETMNVDLDDRKSVSKFLSGVYGCFVVTFIDHSKLGWYESEQSHGRCAADACQDAGVKHVVLSTLVCEVLQVGVYSKIMTSKVEMFDYMKQLGLPVSGVMPSYYYDTILKPGTKAEKISDGVYGFSIPLEGECWALFDVEDIGQIVYHIFQHKEKYANEVVTAVKEILSVDMICDILSKYLAPLHFQAIKISISQFRSSFQHMAEAANAFEAVAKGFDKIFADTETASKIHPTMKTFEEWVVDNLEGLRQVYPV